MTMLIPPPLATTDGVLMCPSCGAAYPPSAVGLDWAVRTPQDVAVPMMVRLGREEREQLWALALNVRNRVISETCVYQGSVSATVVRVGELFTDAIRHYASGVILVHSHPSGEISPSPEDLALTAEAMAAGKLLDCQLLDHIIVSADRWVSLRDRGIDFSRR
jgi:DNA repair protein RadC